MVIVSGLYFRRLHSLTLRLIVLVFSIIGRLMKSPEPSLVDKRLGLHEGTSANFRPSLTSLYKRSWSSPKV